MPSRYLFGDTTLQSSFPLPEIAPRAFADEAPSLLRIEIGSTPTAEPEWIHVERDPAGEEVYCCGHVAGGYLLRFPNVADFWMDRSGTIVCQPSQGTSESFLRHLLLDHVIPRLLAERGQFALHASSVLLADGAVAFLGATGAGKSTLAASFATEAGLPVSDDCLLASAKEGHAVGVPGYFGVRLLADSATQIMASDSPLHEGMGHADKRRFIPTAGTETPSEIARPKLLACFFLDRSDDLTLTRLGPADSLISLVENAFVLDVGTRQAERLAGLARLAELVPCYRLSYPRSYSKLDEVRKQVHCTASSLLA